MLGKAGKSVGASWRWISIGLAVAVVSVAFPPGVDPAGATVPVPPGGVVPVACPDAPGTYDFTGLDDTARSVSLWVPAGASVGFQGNGAMQTTLHGSMFSAQYVFHIVATGGQFATPTDVSFSGYADLDGPSGQWIPFPRMIPTTFAGFTNTTGAAVTYQLALSGARTYAGAGLRWMTRATVTGGDGSLHSSCAGLRPSGANRGGGAPANLRVSDPVDTATGNLYDGFTGASDLTGE